MIKINFCLPRSVRIKLNSRNTTKKQDKDYTAEVDSGQLVRALKILKRELGIYRAHFTGGEPFFYKALVPLLKETKKIGFYNALTTNGQFDAKIINFLKKAGLDSVNFNLNAINPKDAEKIALLRKPNLDSINFGLNAIDPYAFYNMEYVPFKVNSIDNQGNYNIKQTMKNIVMASKYIGTKINCVVNDSSISASKVLDFCMQNKIKLRFLNNLELGDIALDNIRLVIKENGAELIGHEITLISSSHRLDYKINSYQFGVKCIRKFFLQSLCKNCNLKNTKKCLEGFYGIRLEDNPLRVRLCLNKNKVPYVQDFDKFLKSEQFKEIKTMTACVSQYLKKDSIIDEQKNLKV